MRYLTQCSTTGSTVRRNLRVTVVWLEYISRCGLILVSPLLSATQKWVLSILPRGERPHDGHRYVTTLHTRSVNGVRTHVRHASVKYPFLLGSIPLVIYGVQNTPPFAKRTELETKLVQTESIRPQRVDSFKLRWPSIYEPTIVRPQIVEIPVEVRKVERQSGATKVAPVERSERIRVHDICTRHKMRKEFYNQGRSWRCKRV